MTGQLVVAPAGQPLPAHTHLVFELDRGREQMRFRDVRRFGSVTLFEQPADLDAFLADRLGPEPWDLVPAEWRAALAATAILLARASAATTPSAITRTASGLCTTPAPAASTSAGAAAEASSPARTGSGPVLWL